MKKGSECLKSGGYASYQHRHKEALRHFIYLRVTLYEGDSHSGTLKIKGTDIDESGEEEVRMSEEVKAKQLPTQTCGAHRNDTCLGNHI